MVTSLDGAASAQGRSGSIGGPGDKALFGAIRRVADAIVVGAGTARTENYRMPAEPKLLVIVSRSLDLADDLPALVTGRETGRKPIVVAPRSAPADRIARLATSAELVLVDGDPTPTDAVEAAADRGARVISCEGGPSLLAQFVEDDLIDEWCVTVGHCVLSGTAARILAGRPEQRRDVVLTSVLEHEGTLFLRYLRSASQQG